MGTNYQLSTIRSLIDTHLSLQWCRENIVIPLDVKSSSTNNQNTIVIAVGNFTYLGTIGDFLYHKFSTKGLDCSFIQLSSEEIQSLLDQVSDERLFNSQNNENNDSLEIDVIESLSDVAKEEKEESVVKFEFESSEEANTENEYKDRELDLSLEMQGSKIQKAAATVLIDSCKKGASDIHIDPREHGIMIRLRIDGELENYVSVPKKTAIALTACLKNMASMNIAERRKPQDGKISRTYENNLLEFRCSTAPGKHGEKMVLRYLSNNNQILNLDLLIQNHYTRSKFRERINQGNGIIIVSGPTGSGKSTTLASALRERDDGSLNIVTAEDPIEYEMGGAIQQFPVLRAKGQTFANLVRTFLRQDPDVILIGETRDPETAESSMDAAETGHLVFTTLHTNNASESITRLLDMEVPSYKIIASLRGILAQRLCRKVCSGCSVEKPLSETEAALTGLSKGTSVKVATCLSAEEKYKRKKEGTLCDECMGRGYKGRVGIYEFLIITRAISNAIKKHFSAQEIENIAVAEGMITMKAYGVKLIQQQITTVAEISKVCR